MDGPVLTVIVILAALVLLDLAALRFGADSRPLDNDPPNWW